MVSIWMTENDWKDVVNGGTTDNFNNFAATDKLFLPKSIEYVEKS